METKTVHITDPSLDILTWKPHFHANVQVRGMTEEENLVIIYLTVCTTTLEKQGRGAILIRQPVPLCLIQPHIPQIENQTDDRYVCLLIKDADSSN